MAQDFDLVVIGTGTGASTVANKCRKAGWTVAVVDARPYGGTCALRGCDPKKVLVGAAEALDAVRRLQGKGLDAGEARIDWGDLMRFKRSFTDSVPEQRKEAFEEAGIETFDGTARFTGPRSVEVGNASLAGDYIHIASGAQPIDLQIPGQDLLTLSDQFLELDELPPRIVFLGSGYISFEFAHVAAAAGSEVTMLEMLDRPLANFEPDLVSLLAERTEEMGIDLRLKTKVEKVEEGRNGLSVHAASQGKTLTIEADMVVHGAGRVPALKDLELEKGEVEFDPKRGVLVNEYMQSISNPNVYAAGDAADGGLPLTPVAGFEGYTAAANLLNGNRQKIEYPPIPSVVFTQPPLATVGLQERDAASKGIDFEVRYGRTSEWYSSRRVNEAFSGYKVILEKGEGTILGATLFGQHADEVINLFAIAIRLGWTGRQIKELIFAYPTHASDIAYMV